LTLPRVQSILSLGGDAERSPTFFVNGSRVGDRSFDGFKAMIERSLRAEPGKKG